MDDRAVSKLFFNPSLIVWLDDHGMQLDIEQCKVECWMVSGPDFTARTDDAKISTVEDLRPLGTVFQAMTGDKAAQLSFTTAGDLEITGTIGQVDLLCAQAGYMQTQLRR